MFMKLWCLLPLLLSIVADPVAEIHLCDNPVKEDSCTLCCKCPDIVKNVVFYKKTGSMSGEGVCVGEECINNEQRYSLRRNVSGAFLTIQHLQKEMDEDDWSCEFGVDRSKSKTLTVYTYPTNLTVEEVPKHVGNGFTLKAVGYCVYPSPVNVIAKLLQPQDTSNHIPNISYTKATQCELYERSIVVTFDIKPNDFTGDVKFQVITYFDNGRQLVSDPSNVASFPVFDSYPAKIYIPLVVIIGSVVVIVLLITYKFIQRRKGHALRNQQCATVDTNVFNGEQNERDTMIKLVPNCKRERYETKDEVTEKSENETENDVTNKEISNCNGECVETKNEVNVKSENKTDNDVTNKELSNCNRECVETKNEVNVKSENKTDNWYQFPDFKNQFQRFVDNCQSYLKGGKRDTSFTSNPLTDIVNHIPVNIAERDKSQNLSNFYSDTSDNAERIPLQQATST